jgi:hypothetical protein
MAHEDKSEREILLLLVQKVGTHLENHEKTHAVIDKRLDSHSAQLKLLWGGGGLIATVAGLLGMKGH